jgi:4-amino-4-deoxy-L-arabinose transferase-like glycosyltransferase
LHLLPIALFCLWQGGFKQAFLRPLGWIGFCVIGLTWYAIVIQRHPGLLEYFLGYEVYARIATDTHGRYPEWWGGFYVYGLTFLLGTLPWWPLVAAKLRLLKQPISAWSEQSKFLFCWLLIPLLIFMLSRSRLPLYVLPLMAPVALLFSLALHQRISQSAILNTSLFSAVFVVLIKALFAYLPLVYQDTGLSDELHAQQNKNSELFAKQLTKITPFQIQEVAFVDDMARYGLHLYMGVEVEKLGLEAVARPKVMSDAVYDDILLDELKEPEREKRVFVMKQERRELFELQVKQSGYTPHVLGQVFDRWVYRVEKNTPQ